MRIIPAIDIIDGQCVRLSEGDFTTSKVYYSDPLDAACEFESAGLEYLHLVDLDGAKRRKVANWSVLERITSATGLSVDFSGGISERSDIERALELGARQVTIGSLAVRSPELVEEWIRRFGADHIIIGADVRESYITTHGWQERSDMHVQDFIKHFSTAGARHFLCTDVSRDGMLLGPSTELYAELIDQFPDINLIASGGVSSLDDLKTLRSIGCGSAIVGKAIYEHRVTLEELVNV